MANRSKIHINAAQKLYPTGDLYGIFFEDINHAADGGLYAEMIRNRSFEFCEIDHPDYTPMTAWELIARDGGKVIGGVEAWYPLNVNNTHYLRLTNEARQNMTVTGTVGVVNEGYNTGLPLREGEEYRFSMFARRDVNLKSPVEIRLESTDGKLYGKTELVIDSTEWKKYEAELTSDSEDFSGRLVILIHDAGSVCLDMVSLFPKNTFRGRENGLRQDIAQFLADMKPKFMRFPGGCLTHAGAIDDKARDALYRWKNTLGPLESRPSKRNNWRYNQTFGFGYYEFFCFCEDIGTKAMPVLAGGFNPHDMYYAPMDEMQPWVDDALELLEFANGPVTTKWGAYRAELGHPAPFNIEYIAIGNEEQDEQFFERYPLFHKAITEKYPNVKILNTAGPSPTGKGFDLGWQSAREWNSYGVDEHYYVSPDWLIQHYDRYFDKFYDPKGPKVFLGEYASRNNTFYNALCEAAYMTSFELNADKVALTCYAPLLCNTDYVNWTPNMIWYNNHEIYGIPSYYVQKMYSVNQGDVTLPVACDITPEDAYAAPERLSGGITFGAMPGDATFQNIVLNGKPVTEFVFHDDSWSSDGSTIVRDPKDPEPGNGFPRSRHMGFPQDVEIHGDWDDFELSCTAISAEREQEIEAHRNSNFPRRRGVQICFCFQDEDNRISWGLGGFRGGESVMMRHTPTGDDFIHIAPFKFEDGKVYDMKVQRIGERIICTVNGEVLHDVVYHHEAPQRIYVSSTLDEAAGEVIVKAVNVRPSPVTMEIAMDGVGDGPRTVKLETLISDDLEARNTFENPTRVATEYSQFDVEGVPFTYDFPASSVNIFRIPIK